MLNRTAPCAALLALIISAGEASAQTDVIERLKDFKTTGAALDIQTVPQGGEKAASIRKSLERVQAKLPAGFKIDIYALVPDARHMAVGPNVGVVFVGTRKTKVYAVTDRDKDRVGEEVKLFAPSITFKVPNGVCFSRDGFLFVIEHNRALGFPAAEFFYEGPDVEAAVVRETLIPASEESYNHGARTCRIGPDKKLYITQGQPYNVPPAAKRDLYKRSGLGAIVRMDVQGLKAANWEIYIDGMRNSVGMDFNPKNGQLWFTDNQVDGMGDDRPPGELNRVEKMGQNFGFPWYGGGKVQTNDYKNEQPPADVVFPQAEMIPHAADLGMTFYRGSQFPERYRGGIFSAQHGSWNRTDPVGARVMFTPVKEDGTAGEPEPFAEGWLVEDTGEYLGRPVDVAQLQDGSLLVSDDLAGAIYRISYGR